MERNYPVGRGEVQWVSTEWMEDHLSDRDLSILDTQPDMLDYVREHLPGALYLSDRAFSLPLAGIPGGYQPLQTARSTIRELGLKPDAPVVVYSGRGMVSGCGDGLEAAAMAYTLLRYGHGKVYVLDGGIEQWKAERKPLAQEFPEVERSDFPGRLRDELVIGYEDFRSVAGTGNVTLIDARPADQYEGQGPWIKPGHIPGAFNVPWTEFADPDNPWRLRAENDLRETVERRGIAPENTIICSGGDSREAAPVFLVLRDILGFPRVRMYEGSFTEWTAYPRNPTVTGQTPNQPETEPEHAAAG